MHPNPRISGILTTYNRSELLVAVLDSLCGQTLPQQQFEIVIVDDGSTDDTHMVVDAFVSRLPLRYVYQQNSGLAAAKNTGIGLAKGNVVLFMDDDDVASSELLAQHLLAHELYPSLTTAVLGYTRLAPAIANDVLMQFVTEVGCFLFSYPHLTAGAELDYTYFWGGRSSCKRELLDTYGNFNGAFRFGCEDIELGFRLARHGLQVRYHPSAVTEMIRAIDFDGFLRRLSRQGESQFVFSRLHREAEVQRWCEIPAWQERRENLAVSYQPMIQSAKSMDKLVRSRMREGLTPSQEVLDLLHFSYRRAFEATKIAGIESAWNRANHAN